MTKKIYVLLLLTALSVCVYPQVSVVKSGVKKVTKEFFKKSGETATKKSLNRVAMKASKNSIENAVVEQTLKKATREKFTALMKKDGVKSFLDYGRKSATAKVSVTTSSLTKRKAFTGASRTSYKERIFAQQQGNSHLSAKGRGVLSRKIPNTPGVNSVLGRWKGERGNSLLILDLNRKPSAANYGNPKNQTVREMGKELGDPNPQITFKNHYPIFDRDYGTKNKRPLQITFSKGIKEYINADEVIKKNGKNVNRAHLHEEAYKRLAKQQNCSVEEIKVFKGDSDVAKKLSKEWNCSIQEVFNRCKNPNQIQRVLHECEDMKTVQLVPRLYHNELRHDGGIEKVAKLILYGIEN